MGLVIPCVAWTTLCTLAPFYIPQSYRSGVLQHELDRLQLITTFIDKKVSHYETEIIEQEKYCQTAYLKQPASDIFNQIYDEVEELIKPAKSSGKNVNTCYNQTETKMNEAAIKKFEEMSRCEQDSLRALMAAFNFANEIRSNATKLQGQLASILPSCAWNKFKLLDCVENKLQGLNIIVTNLQKTAIETVQQGEENFKMIVQQYKDCMAPHLNELREEARKAVQIAQQCVNSLE